MEKSYLRRIKQNVSVSQLVINRITDGIIRGELKPGDKLPTEYELAESLGVGRNGIREAIKILEYMGIVDIKHAEGTFVTNEFNPNIFNPLLYGIVLEADSGIQMYYYRESFDMGVMLLDIEIASDESIQEIEKAFNKLETAMKRESPDCDEIIDCDLEFHSSYYAATQNPMIIAQGDMVNRVTQYTRRRNMQKIIERGELSRSLESHRQLLNTIKFRDTNNLHEALINCFSVWHKKLEETTEGVDY